MTTFSYTIVLNDSESIALEAALKLLVEHCDRELQSNPRAPFYAWRDSAMRIHQKLYEDTRQTSGHDRDPETGSYRIWIAGAGLPKGTSDTDG